MALAGMLVLSEGAVMVISLERCCHDRFLRAVCVAVVTLHCHVHHVLGCIVHSVSRLPLSGLMSSVCYWSE